MEFGRYGIWNLEESRGRWGSRAPQPYDSEASDDDTVGRRRMRRSHFTPRKASSAAAEIHKMSTVFPFDRAFFVVPVSGLSFLTGLEEPAFTVVRVTMLRSTQPNFRRF